MLPNVEPVTGTGHRWILAVQVLGLLRIQLLARRFGAVVAKKCFQVIIRVAVTGRRLHQRPWLRLLHVGTGRSL